jgi:hypothetical protein
VTRVEELELQTSDDLVSRLAHEGEPVRAVVELIWNAVDAEATSVEVLLERSESDAVVGVTVEDDGHGISSDEVRATFGRIGDSWKRLSARSKNEKRALHGKLGQGRLRAFALGSRVTWDSNSVNTAGEKQRVLIQGDRSNRKVFQWDVSPGDFDRPGTKVTAQNDEQRSVGALEKPDAAHKLLEHFAPLLLNDGELSVLYDGVQLDFSNESSHRFAQTPSTGPLGQQSSIDGTDGSTAACGRVDLGRRHPSRQFRSGRPPRRGQSVGRPSGT